MEKEVNFMLSLYYEENDNLVSVYELDKIKDIISSKDKVTLLKVTIPNEDDIHLLTEILQLHLVTIRDFSSTKHLPKIEEFSTYISTIMYDIELTSDENCYNTIPVNIILMEKLTLVLCKTNFPAFDEMLLRIAANPKDNFEDSSRLYYMALDVLIDKLFPIIACFENRLDVLQENILKDGGKDYTQKLMNLRSNLLKLKKSFTYEQEVLYEISYDKFKLISVDEIEFLKNVFHHIERLNATLQEYNDWASTLSDAYANLSASKVNERLQILTVIQYIFMPLGFLTGWYGMNFKMPETDPAIAYYIFMGIVSTISISIIVYFKKKKML